MNMENMAAARGWMQLYRQVTCMSCTGRLIDSKILRSILFAISEIKEDPETFGIVDKYINVICSFIINHPYKDMREYYKEIVVGVSESEIIPPVMLHFNIDELFNLIKNNLSEFKKEPESSQESLPSGTVQQINNYMKCLNDAVYDQFQITQNEKNIRFKYLLDFYNNILKQDLEIFSEPEIKLICLTVNWDTPRRYGKINDKVKTIFNFLKIAPLEYRLELCEYISLLARILVNDINTPYLFESFASELQKSIKNCDDIVELVTCLKPNELRFFVCGKMIGLHPKDFSIDLTIAFYKEMLRKKKCTLGISMENVLRLACIMLISYLNMPENKNKNCNDLINFLAKYATDNSCIAETVQILEFRTITL